MSQYVIVWLCYTGLIVMMAPLFKSFAKNNGKKVRTKIVTTLLAISIGLFVLFGVGLSFYNALATDWFNPFGILLVIGLLSMAGGVVSIYLIYKE